MKKYISCIDPVYTDIISTQEPIDLHFWHLYGLFSWTKVNGCITNTWYFQHLRNPAIRTCTTRPGRHRLQPEVSSGKIRSRDFQTRRVPTFRLFMPISIHIPYHLEFKYLKPMAMYCILVYTIYVVRSSKYKAEGKKQLVSKNSKQK